MRRPLGILAGVLATGTLGTPLAALAAEDRYAAALRALTDHEPRVAALFAEHPWIAEVYRDPMWQDVVLDAPRLPGTPWRIHDLRRPPPPKAAADDSYCREPVAAPAGAVQVFGGGGLEGFVVAVPDEWRVEAGELVPGNRRANRLATVERFGPVQLHVEFRLPADTTTHWQYRGNSGVFLMERYEIQILDSWDNPTYPDGQAGALYGQRPPLVNASRPGGQWQCYDIFFTPPRFRGRRVEAPARVTLLHNGVVVQANAAFLGPTQFAQIGAYEPHAPELPFTLQDHGDGSPPVHFRNVWAVRLPAAVPP